MKIIFIFCLIFSLSVPAMAGDGHNHGDSAFANNQMSKAFDLTEIQIQNLQLTDETVIRRDLYQTTTIGMSLKRDPSQDTIIAQGFILEDKRLFEIEKGMRTIIQLDILPEQDFYGEIYEINTEMDPFTKMFSIYSKFISPLPFSFTGLKGEMIIFLNKQKNALAISKEALQGDNGDYYVFVRKGKHFERRSVSIGDISGKYIEITHGLTEGEKIVIQGSHQLQFISTSNNEHKHDQEEE